MTTPGEILRALEQRADRQLSLWRRMTAPQLFVGSFVMLVVLGTVLLLTLPGLYTGERLSFVDALFTATSAVCVTGLIVVDTATYFTTAGQALLLLLIQLGGLGLLSLTTLVILMIEGRLSLRGETAVGAASAVPTLDPKRLVRSVFRYTFLIEGVGALLLWVLWAFRMGPEEAVWPAVFHAISAFCNAGFSIFSTSLMGFGDDVATLTVVMTLIVLGGLGFLVLEEVWGLRRDGGRGRLSLHARLVLVTSAMLVVGGALLFAAFEWNNVLRPFPLLARPFEALFLSITPRTAGFNTVPYSELTSASLLLTMILMLIGGGPGSTAGGLKVTTFAVIAALAISRVRGLGTIHIFRRSLPEGTIQRATGLVVFVVALIAGATLLLQVTELPGVPHPLSRGVFLELAFEAVSAFNTVGLSTGLTGGLSSGGKLLMVLLMFVGRVGPITFVASMIVRAQRRRARVRYVSEDVVVG